MEEAISEKFKAIIKECDAAQDKIASLKQQSTQFLNDCHAIGQPLFSQHNYQKIDEQLSKILENFEFFKSSHFSFTDEAFSYAISHHPKDSTNRNSNNSPVYDMEYVAGEKPWNFVLKYVKDERWKVLKRSLAKNLSENLLQPYGRTPETGSHVLYSERNRVSRGVVLQILPSQPDKGNTLKLLDVDTSAIKFVSTDKLYHVNLIAASVHSQILHCCLENDFNPSMWPSELSSIFTDALRGSLLRVTILGKYIEEDIEITYVPTYSVKVIAIKAEEQVVIDINEWILKHVYPALMQSNGSFQCIDLTVFDAHRYCLSDAECDEILNNESDDRLADFDDLQTETMSVMSERTMRGDIDGDRDRASTPISSSLKATCLSPHAAVFTFTATTSPASTDEKPAPVKKRAVDLTTSSENCSMDISETSDMKSPIKCDAATNVVPNVDDVTQCLAKLMGECTPNVNDILSQVFSKDECKDLIRDKGDEDKKGASSQSEQVSEIFSHTSGKAELKETPMTQNLSKPASPPVMEKKATTSQESNKAEKKTPAASKATPHIPSGATQSASPTFQQDPLMHPQVRRPMGGTTPSYPPGFGPPRPVPSYQHTSSPHTMYRPALYGVASGYQGSNIYIPNQYTNQMFYGTTPSPQPQYNMAFFHQQRFNPPMVNPQQVYNPLGINPSPLSQPQPLNQPPHMNQPQQPFYAYQSQVAQMGFSQNLQTAKAPETIKSANEPNTSKTTSSSKVVENISEMNKRKHSNASASSKDSLSSTDDKAKNAKDLGAQSSKASQNDRKWSTNDLESNSGAPSSSKAAKLSQIVPVFILPASTDCIAKSSTLTGLLTYYINPHHFYLRLCNEKTSSSDQLAQEMIEYYSDANNSIEFKTKKELKSALGDYAACIWAVDNNWYRVEILDWDLDDEHVSVHYVDYGNPERAHWRSLQPLKKQFTKYARMTTRCSFGRIKPVGSSEWEKPVNEFIQSLHNPAAPVLVKVEEDYDPESGNILMVDLACPDKHQNKTFRDLLLENNFASLEESEAALYETWKPMEEDYCSIRNSYELDTDDACVAVSGYKPTDDARICQFYAKLGTCWKQDKCKLEHSRYDPEGFTTDRIPVFTAALNQLEAPSRNSEITVKVLEVVSLNRFYAHLPPHMTHLMLGDEVYMKFENLVKVLNDSTNIRCFKHLITQPAAGELVLVKHDDVWYRARVLSPESGGLIQVFFVDCGTTADVPRQDFRQMEASYLKLPFQAVECQIINICPKEGLSAHDYETGLSFLSDLIESTNPLIKVIGAEPGDKLCLEVLVKSGDSGDVGEAMIEAGYCVFKEIVSSKNYFSKKPLPG